MNRFLFLTFNGLSFGAVYAAVALSLVIIWRATRVLNFAQGAMAVASAYVAITVTSATGSYWLGFAAALGSGFLLGIVVERTVFRSADRMPVLNTIVVGVGLLILIEAAVGMVFGAANRELPPSLSTQTIVVGEVPLVSPQNIFTISSVLVVMLALGALFTWTPTGLRMARRHTHLRWPGCSASRSAGC